MKKSIALLTIICITAVLVVSGCTGGTSKETETTEQPKEEVKTSEPACTPDWSCGEWSECGSEGEQTRTCTDKNNCGTIEGKPGESQSCTYVAKIGDKIKDYSIEYTVTEAFTLPALGSGYTFKMADGTFVIIGLTIKNNGKKETSVTTSRFELIDSEGREYNVDTTALVYLGVSGFQALPVIKNIGAGLETAGYIVFDVPEDDEGLVLNIGGGLLSEPIPVKIGDVADLSE